MRLLFFQLFLFIYFSQTFAQIESDTNLIREHLRIITKRDKYRHFENPDELDSVAAYIFRDFSKYADTVYYQPFKINGVTYRNVIASFGTDQKNRSIRSVS